MFDLGSMLLGAGKGAAKGIGQYAMKDWLSNAFETENLNPGQINGPSLNTQMPSLDQLSGLLGGNSISRGRFGGGRM